MQQGLRASGRVICAAHAQGGLPVCSSDAHMLLEHKRYMRRRDFLGYDQFDSVERARKGARPQLQMIVFCYLECEKRIDHSSG